MNMRCAPEARRLTTSPSDTERHNEFLRVSTQQVYVGDLQPTLGIRTGPPCCDGELMQTFLSLSKTQPCSSHHTCVSIAQRKPAARLALPGCDPPRLEWRHAQHMQPAHPAARWTAALWTLHSPSVSTQDIDASDDESTHNARASGVVDITSTIYATDSRSHCDENSSTGSCEARSM